jgi:hypothetical protein
VDGGEKRREKRKKEKKEGGGIIYGNRGGERERENKMGKEGILGVAKKINK